MLSHYICSDHLEIHREIKVEKQNMGNVHSRNEWKAYIGFLCGCHSEKGLPYLPPD